ncbi:MAG: STAS domain-containing protein [Devosia sp.]|nr:STAS domain-containing protein [Devosia sp.]
MNADRSGYRGNDAMAKAPQNLVKLPAVLDLDALDAARDSLVGALERGPVTISAAAVERVSTNALLMLLSAAETARRNDIAFAIAGATAPVTAAIARLGFGDKFAGLMKG